jgi:membrane-associated phospholipid phosphatase
MDRQRRAPSSAPPRAERRSDAALYSTVRFIARHVGDYWTALSLFVGLGVAAWGIAAVTLAAIFGAAGAPGGGLLRGADEQALLWFYSGRTLLLDQVMTRVSRLGDGIVVTAIAVTVATVLALTQRRWAAYLLLGSVIGGQVMNNVLKLIFARPRPGIVEWGTDVMTASFPSGHAMSAMLCYGSLAYAIHRLDYRPAVRATAWLVATLLILGIGLSRVYLGVHYPTDVAAGFAAGFAWILFIAATGRAARLLDTDGVPGSQPPAA